MTGMRRLGLSAVSFDGVLVPPPALVGTGRLLSGTVTGSARLFDATPGGVSVSIVGNVGLGFLILSGRGGLALLGTRLNGPLSGRYVCFGFACRPLTLGGVSGSFR